MLYFVILIILTLICSLLYKGRLLTKRAVCFIISIYLIFLFGIRLDTVGNVDIPRYISAFDTLRNLNISQISHYYSKDIGFYYFTKFISNIYHNYNFWFTLMGVLFISSISKLIIKYSPNVLISYIIFYTFFFAINFSLLRHSCALAFVIFGYVALKEDKPIKAFILLSIASLFHLSAILSFLFFLLKRVKFGKWNFLMIFTSFIISITIPDLLSRILGILSMERFSFYANFEVKTLTKTSFYIHLALLFIMLLLIRIKSKDEMNKYSFELNMYSVGIVFYALVGILAEFFRIGMFFSFILIVLLPKILDDNAITKNKFIFQAGSVIFVLLMLIYFFSTVLFDGELIPFDTIINLKL